MSKTFMGLAPAFILPSAYYSAHAMEILLKVFVTLVSR